MAGKPKKIFVISESFYQSLTKNKSPNSNLNYKSSKGDVVYENIEKDNRGIDKMRGKYSNTRPSWATMPGGDNSTIRSEHSAQVGNEGDDDDDDNERPPPFVNDMPENDDFFEENLNTPVPPPVQEPLHPSPPPSPLPSALGSPIRPQTSTPRGSAPEMDPSLIPSTSQGIGTPGRLNRSRTNVALSPAAMSKAAASMALDQSSIEKVAGATNWLTKTPKGSQERNKKSPTAKKKGEIFTDPPALSTRGAAKLGPPPKLSDQLKRKQSGIKQPGHTIQFMKHRGPDRYDDDDDNEDEDYDDES